MPPSTSTAQIGAWPVVAENLSSSSWDAAWSPMFGERPAHFTPPDTYTSNSSPSNISPSPASRVHTQSGPIVNSTASSVTMQDNTPPSTSTPQHQHQSHITSTSNSHLTPTTRSTQSNHTTSHASSSPSPKSTPSPNNATPSSSATSQPPTKIQKRTLNTIAARRYRQKRVDQMSSLEFTLKETENERDELKLKVARLEAEVGVLRGLVRGG